MLSTAPKRAARDKNCAGALERALHLAEANRTKIKSKRFDTVQKSSKTLSSLPMAGSQAGVISAEAKRPKEHRHL